MTGSGSNTMPPDANYMFVTSATKPPKDIGGLLGGDTWCNDLAQAAGLDGTYRAWLSSSNESAKTRLAEKRARGWYRADGKPFADTIDDLTSGRIYYPPRVTETGMDIGEAGNNLVATGTWASGAADGGAVFGDCTGFTADGATLYGFLDAAGGLWTDNENSESCATPMHIYCFGITKEAQIFAPAPTPDSKLVFVAAAMIDTSGITGLNAACKNAAASIGLTGTFNAWTSTTASPAGSPGPSPWRRSDNVIAVTEGGDLIAPIDVTVDGMYLSQYKFVWTGSTAPALAAAPGGNCSDWTTKSVATAAIVGDPTRSVLALAWDATTSACTTDNYVDCLEQ